MYGKQGVPSRFQLPTGIITVVSGVLRAARARWPLGPAARLTSLLAGSIAWWIDLRYLRTRLALAFALAAALPVLITGLLCVERERRLESQTVRSDLQAQASAVARNVAAYVVKHQVANGTLATQPGLPDMAADEQQQLLLALAGQHPGFIALASFDASGSLLAGSDDRPAITAPGFPQFKEVRHSSRPVVSLLAGHIRGRPVVVFGVPIRDQKGRFAGVARGVVDLQEASARFAQGDAGMASLGWVLDARGQVLVSTRTAPVPPFIDLTATPPVTLLPPEDRAAGVISSHPADGERLVADARVPDAGWTVLLKRPATAALDGLRARTMVALGWVALIALGAAAVGALAARWLTAPLRTLEQAAGRLASGDGAIAWPQSSIREVASLVTAVQTMAERLAARTAEREHVAAELRALNTTLEHRVAAQTAALNGTIKDLHRQVEQRIRLAEALRRSQRHLATMLQASPVPLALTSRRTARILYANDCFVQLIGYPHEAVVGRTSEELQLWLELADRERLVRLMEERGGVGALEVQIRTSTGEVRDILLCRADRPRG